MAKGKDSQKSVKKAPAKSLKEKRNDKKLKKQGQNPQFLQKRLPL